MTALPNGSSMLRLGSRPAVTELFHRIGRVLPEDQEVLSLTPRMKVFEAIERLHASDFSQAPVIESGTVVGIFSYRSFAIDLALRSSDKIKPAEMLVEECMETIGPDEFRSIAGEFPLLLDLLDAQDSVLIGEPERLQGIVTPMDVLRYLYGIAGPFVLLTEIELGVRGLIRHCVGDDGLVACAEASLNNAYVEGGIPLRLEDMNFSDYVSIIGDGRNWSFFENAFGGSRYRARAKLDDVREMRNIVFHLKRELEQNEHAELRRHRDWILQRCNMIDARGRAEANHG